MLASDHHTFATEMQPQQINIQEVRQGLSFLCHDLRTFQSNERAIARLNNSTALHNIGPPYVLSEDVMELPVDSLHPPLASNKSDVDNNTEDLKETLGHFLSRRTAEILDNRRVNGKNDFILCTSHDLAPLIQEATGLQRGFDEAKAWKKSYKTWEKSLR